ncbi:MAG: D-aminoacylase [Desulfobacterales bacterium]|nr:MAG: D-aminoacylase [Desulfobacterales bacterium]
MFDLLIKNATIIDGTGAKGWQGDAAVRDGRFAVIARRVDGAAVRHIDAQGLVLAPGFIDVHCHSDVALLDEPRAEIKVRQGVTLEVIGNCGASLAPLEPESRADVLNDVVADLGRLKRPIAWLSYADYAAVLDQTGLAINVMGLVGHGTLRIAALGYSDRSPDKSQMSRMCALLAAALEQGACGLSTGLIYPPGCFAATPELIDLAGVLRSQRGFYASHMRNEAEKVLEAVDEVIRIGRQAHVPVHISHLKVAGKKNWHLADQVAAKIESARARGVDITCDVYPYFCSGTTMLALLPPWSLEGGVPALIARLNAPRQRERIIGHIKEGIPGWENMYHNCGWDKIVVSSVKTEAHKHLEGRSVARLAAEGERDPFEMVLDLIAAEEGAVSIVAESMREENVARFIALPFAMIGSDGAPTSGRPHPRLYGTFPRVIRRFVRELGTLTLPEAVHKMTGLTAQRLGLNDRGTMAVGGRADAVLFDPHRFSDTATYENPRSYPEGLQAVLVNGQVVIDGRTYTGAVPGRFQRA